MTLREGSAAARAAALGLLALLLGLIYLGPVSSYLDWLAAERQSVAAASAVLARDQRLVQEGAAPAPALASILFPEMSDAQAAALLQEALKAAAGKARVEIEGMEVLPAEPLGGARRIGVRLRARGDMGGIARLLYAIEAARPVLYADNLQIQSRAVPGVPAANALGFQLEVSGFSAGAS